MATINTQVRIAAALILVTCLGTAQGQPDGLGTRLSEFNIAPRIVQQTIEGASKTLQADSDSGAVEVSDAHGWTPLMVAVLMNRRDIVARALDLRSNVNARLAATARVNHESLEGYSPLLLAVRFHCDDAVDLLLDAKADPNIDSATGMNSVLTAAALGRSAVFTHLVSRGGRIHSKGPGGQTALMFAALSGDAETVRACIEYKCAPDGVDDAGNTALMLAPTAPVAELLVAFGADRSIRNHAGLTAQEIAHLAGREDVARLVRP